MIVVAGASGYVGSAICRELSLRRLDFVPLSRSQVDYYAREEMKACLCKYNARLLINAAGFTGRPNVDACELHKAECLQANAVLPGLLRDVCDELGIVLGHISSGCIFTGERANGLGFAEVDTPNFTFRQGNCSFYSGSKALGEFLLAGASRIYIWRLRIPFNNVDGPKNYLTKLMAYPRLLDVRNSLSHLDEFAAACVESWQRRIPFGIYNLTNPGSLTTRRIAALIREHLDSSRTFEFFDHVEQFMAECDRTPRSHCVLNSGKAANAGLHLRPVEQALIDALKNWRPATPLHQRHQRFPETGSRSTLVH